MSDTRNNLDKSPEAEVQRRDDKLNLLLRLLLAPHDEEIVQFLDGLRIERENALALKAAFEAGEEYIGSLRRQGEKVPLSPEEFHGLSQICQGIRAGTGPRSRDQGLLVKNATQMDGLCNLYTVTVGERVPEFDFYCLAMWAYLHELRWTFWKEVDGFERSRDEYKDTADALYDEAFGLMPEGADEETTRRTFCHSYAVFKSAGRQENASRPHAKVSPHSLEPTRSPKSSARRSGV